jgi:6-phosphogluconolactonase
MLEPVWHVHGRGFDLEVAQAVADILGRAMKQTGRAFAAFPGGATPAPIFECLPREPFPWNRVTLIPTDERDVTETHALSNVRMLKETFAPLGATVRSLADTGSLDFPLDLAWLGMGEDGHTASLFPGPDLDAAFASGARVVAVRPAPLPANAPVSRQTLTPAVLAGARHLLVTITGETKRRVLEAAVAGADLPIGRLLARAGSAPQIHWRP